ncbi:hypothetical protein ATJ97_0064 [Georgenia soli]|uniref:MarR family protein n=2 Tax=Georgenia soli TaxID=638953 RepID=A0A2A9F3L6_9MICO|nr:hypothetical protein ATJ97_0064 [Georgenia soli]
MSPRGRVRVAAVDAYGQALNVYSGHTPTSAPVPEQPWAVYLANQQGRFCLVAFDLDAKADPTAAARDAEMLVGLLEASHLPHVVCESGPGGGRHIWLALSEGVAAETVAIMGRLAKTLCPTLDLAPLSNPATGCVRPPGAPHRHGGASTVLAGSLETLMQPTVTAEQLTAFVATLARLVDHHEPAGEIELHQPVPVDAHGHLYLPGPRRALPAASAAALAEDAAAGDASAVLWRVLIGAAAARWHHEDIAALASSAPGLEHVRTRRDRSDRTPRPTGGPDSGAAVLRRQWHKAVRYVAATARTTGDDPTFDARAGAVAAHVREVQARADTSPGRWATRSGPTDRRVLDVLCLLAVQALTAEVEADIRRLALLAGIGRETARTALLRLAEEGWISQTRPADGPHAAHWTIDPRNQIHRDAARSRSQADPRPEGAGAAHRSTLIAELAARTQASAHDAFTTAGGLGHHAGNLYARTTDEPLTLGQLAEVTGTTHSRTSNTLERLATFGLITRTADGWIRSDRDRRDTAARHLGTRGRLRERAARYCIERELWAWWQAEQEWMRAPRRTSPGRRPGPGQLALLPADGTNVYGAHPRRPDGRADYAAARRQLLAGTSTTEQAITRTALAGVA